jgi:hypothetical protein
LKETTGQTESEIVRRGLQLVAQEEGRRRCALELAGRSVGRFKKVLATCRADQTFEIPNWRSPENHAHQMRHAVVSQLNLVHAARECFSVNLD